MVYTADHGEMDGDHGLYQKFCLFDPSVGVPLIVSYPSKLPENQVSHELVEYMGIYPTVAELSGTGVPRGIDSSSFAELARKPDRKGPDAVFSEFNLKARTDCYMVRTKRYKYIFNRGEISELYDLEADPRENVNRTSDTSLGRVRAELHDRLMAWHKIV